VSLVGGGRQGRDVGRRGVGRRGVESCSVVRAAWGRVGGAGSVGRAGGMDVRGVDRAGEWGGRAQGRSVERTGVGRSVGPLSLGDRSLIHQRCPLSLYI
jgi:hypothetical protein